MLSSARPRRQASCDILHAQQRVQVLLRVESVEILETLANADELYGHREFRFDPQYYPGSGTAIHLRHRQAGEADRLLKHLNLLRRVLPDVGIEDGEDFVG